MREALRLSTNQSYCVRFVSWYECGWGSCKRDIQEKDFGPKETGYPGQHEARVIFGIKTKRLKSNFLLAFAVMLCTPLLHITLGSVIPFLP